MKYRQFFERPLSWVQNLDVYGDAVTSDYLPKDMAYFFELYQDCFQHHVQSRLQASGDTLTVIADESRKRLVQQDELTAYFLKNIYQPANISYSQNASTIDQKKHARTFIEMVEDITGNPIDNEFPNKTNKPGTNRVNFLIGDVGVGKSLLTTKVIAEVEAINASRPPPYYVLPVYIDFELLLKTERDSFKDIDDSFIDDILNIIQTLLEKNGQWNVKYQDTTSENTIQKFIRLNLHLLRDNIRLFLLFDNTDRYHFYYSKYTFFEKYKQQQVGKVKRNFTAIFNMFSRVELLGDQGLTVLFVCRRAVLRYWMGAGRPEDNQKSLIKDYGVYQISKIDELDAIRARVKLAEIAITAIEDKQPGKAKDYLNHLRIIEGAFEKSLNSPKRNSLSTVKDLTHHGTRSFIDFIGSLRIDYRTQYELVTRLFEEQPHNLLRLYIVNLRKRFAQFNDHFPNLFLVDAVVSPEEDFKEEAHGSHRHTYWLKYLLLKYIVSLNHRKEVVTYHRLREHFVDACKYEAHLFDLALGSLNAVNSFRCIEVNESIANLGDCIRIKPTQRGITLISIDAPSEFCFDFDYLQFVIDDPQLSFPLLWGRRIYVDTDIGYMMSATSVYTSGLSNYLRLKSEAVIYFLHVLKHSAKFELGTRLHNDSEISHLLPNFDEIFKKLFDVYSKLVPHHVQRGIEEYNKLEHLHKTLCSDESQFTKFFEGYAEHQCPVEPA